MFPCFAVDHDSDASFSCAFTWKPLNQITVYSYLIKTIKINVDFHVKLCIKQNRYILRYHSDICHDQVPSVSFKLHLIIAHGQVQLEVSLNGKDFGKTLYVRLSKRGSLEL